MRRRLVASTAVIALAAVLVLGIPLALLGSARVRGDEQSRLEREADGLAAVAVRELERDGRVPAGALADLLPAGHAATVTAPGLRLRIGRPPAAAIRANSGAAQGPQVTVTGPATAVASEQRTLWLGVAALAALGVAAAVALAALQARRLLAPLERLTRTSARLGHGDFSARAGRFELAELARVGAALDGAALQIAHLVGRHGEFSANVSHQLRSPLAALRLRLEEIAALGDAEAMRSEAAAALAVADRLEATVDHLLAHASEGTAGAAAELDLAELARTHAAAWLPLFAQVGRSVEVTGPASLLARAPVGAPAQALDVLLDNALRHGDGTVRVAVDAAGDRARITVLDEGPGVPAALAEGIFARTVSTAGATGLGLPLARALVEAAGGTLRLAVLAPPRFELLLPATAPGPTTSRPASGERAEAT